MIVPFESLPSVRRTHEDEQIVFAGGCYDLIHEGHVESLEWRRSQGDLLVVGVSSDERVEQRKGPGRPIRSELGRLAVISAFRAVDYAFLMPLPNEQTPTMQVLSTLRPNIFIDSTESRERWLEEQEAMHALGVTLQFDEQEKRDSTTDIIKRVHAARIENTNL
ncbi:MAG TPA: adenylyltransferase/cytidyltransferase family protein [Candidatus Saccharimonadales bacterium]|nr:adenylyltransferase/cytidyltransferase family protein [Candidatus Saccharimonadales bacterium]